ncbi:Na+/H+ antiporter NhaA [Ammonifex degensii KC4]|uniref:Na(+)/H(+) antiporter NhaA n=1 Tax=Ammonifex degensii (strain DSM 10501 / KC4) TaxID=429009 RepID=C9RAD2_AMMDK|nr:Na+/H+ antiporter NhaA [Ammonifex degensii]ACX51241.1 Na+/H+ antiporter NhaA [Ammonifex degensii KC4]
MLVARVNKLFRPFETFFKDEAASGIVLLVATVMALILANSSLSSFYYQVLEHPVSVGIGPFVLTESVQQWINDGLMAVFFFTVGMEIKREILRGELSAPGKATLPVVAALGGMVLPAIIYLAINWGAPTAHGWGIPIATDIAFALGVLTLAGRNVPRGLAVFLTALAIADDLGAIIVIALFLTEKLFYPALLAAGLVFLALLLLNKLGVRWIPAYLLLGIALWIAVFESGVHATLAGVLLGMAIPAEPRSGEQHSPLEKLECRLVPWVSFGILPIFALANAGITLQMEYFKEIVNTPVFWGVVLGLFLGKQLGVFLFSYALVRAGMATLPDEVSWGKLYGAGILCGIGFTMSIFIAGLSLKDPVSLEAAKLGIICASLVSGIVGVGVLRLMETLKKEVSARS